jgi:hypothetical protein
MVHNSTVEQSSSVKFLKIEEQKNNSMAKEKIRKGSKYFSVP